MSENTPTPWAHREGILHEADDRWKCLPINSPYVEGAFEAGNDGHDVAVANAAFIVKAVNSHDALVAALKEAVSQLIPFHEDGDQPAIFCGNRCRPRRPRINQGDRVMVAHCSPPIDQFASYCEKMKRVYGAGVPLMSRATWDAACNEPRKARKFTEAEFDYSNFNEEMGDGQIY